MSSPIHRGRLQAWVDALRSGEYTQARRKLRPDEGFCCLGVACDIAIKDGLGVTWKPYRGGYAVEWDRGVLDDDPFLEEMTLPEPVMNYYGLEDVEELFVGQGEDCEQIIDANDGGRWTFQQIADDLERQFLAQEKGSTNG